MAGKDKLTIRITRSHCLGRGRDVEEGTLLTAPGDLTIAEARIKIATGYAVEVPGGATGDAREPETAPGAAVESRDPGITSRDPGIKTPASEPAKDEAPAKRKPSSSKRSGSRRRRKSSS